MAEVADKVKDGQVEKESAPVKEEPAKPAAPLTKAEAKKLKTHGLQTGALGLDVTRDGKTAYIVCIDGGVWRVDTESGHHQRIGEAHSSYAANVKIVEEGKLAISAGYDGVLLWHDLEAGKTVRRVKAHNFWSWDMALSPDRRFVASVTGQYLAGGYQYEPAPETEPSVRVYEIATGKLAHSFSHTPSVQSVAFSPNSKYVAAGNLMGQVRVWDVETGKLASEWKTDALTSWGIIKSHCYIGGIFAMRFLNADQLVVAGMGPMRDPMAGNGEQLWQRFAWREQPVKKIDQTHKRENGSGLMETMALYPGGGLFAMAGRLVKGDWNAAIFRETDGARVASFNTGTRVTGAAFSESPSRLFLSGGNGQPSRKDGKYGHWGKLHIYDVKVG